MFSGQAEAGVDAVAQSRGLFFRTVLEHENRDASGYLGKGLAYDPESDAVAPHQRRSSQQHPESRNAVQADGFVYKGLLHAEEGAQADSFIAIARGLAAPRRAIEHHRPVRTEAEGGLVVVQQARAGYMLQPQTGPMAMQEA